MPGVPIGLNVNLAGHAEQRKVQEIPGLADSQPPLPLGTQPQTLEFGPQAIFERAFVKQVVDLAGLAELLPGGGDEYDASQASAIDRGWKAFQAIGFSLCSP